MIKDKKSEISTDEKNKRTKKRKKTFLKVLCTVLAVIACLIVVTSIVTAIGNSANMKKAMSFDNANTRQLEIKKESAGNVNIYCDDELNVMQLTDVHIGGGWMSLKKDSMAINAVASMITAEKPDLVVVSGDVAYPIIFQAGTINNFNGIKIFASLMETLGVYWTMTFGNHDVEIHSIHSYEDILNLLASEEYPHCLLSTVEGDVDGYSNQVVKVINDDGVITRAFVLFDSHAYVTGYIPGINMLYDNVHENQIQWYKQVINSLNEKNETVLDSLPDSTAKTYRQNFSNVPTSVFMHIPMIEYRDAWNEYVDNGYKNTDDVSFVSGFAGEKVCCPMEDDALFETMLEMKSTDTVFCGHDHYNCYSVDYKGIKLTYGMSIDYLAYIGIVKVGNQRGCTMITYYPDGTVNYHAENYYQDKYYTAYEKETVEMNTDM